MTDAIYIKRPNQPAFLVASDTAAELAADGLEAAQRLLDPENGHIEEDLDVGESKLNPGDLLILSRLFDGDTTPSIWVFQANPAEIVLLDEDAF